MAIHYGGRREVLREGPRRLLYRGVILWLIVTFVRPQDIVPALRVLPLGLIALGIIVASLIWLRDFRPARDGFSKLSFALLVVIALGAIKAVNTYWLFQTFISMVTYWIVFFLALPLVMESSEHRAGVIRAFFISFATIALWVLTHGGHGQGAFLGDENDAAVALGVGFGLCFPLRSYLPGKMWRAFSYAVLGLCVAGIIATMSRGGFVGLLAGLFAIAYFSRKVFKTLFALAILGLLAFPLVPNEYVGEVRTISDTTESTAVQRLYMWRIGVQMYMSNPLIGVGAGNYAYRVADYEGTEFVQRANIFGRSFGGRAVHSTYFQFLSELGTLGATIFLLMMWRVMFNGISIGKSRNNDSLVIALSQGTAAGAIFFLAAGAFVSAAYYPQFWMLCGLSASVPYIQGKLKQ